MDMDSAMTEFQPSLNAFTLTLMEFSECPRWKPRCHHPPSLSTFHARRMPDPDDIDGMHLVS